MEELENIRRNQEDELEERVSPLLEKFDTLSALFHREETENRALKVEVVTLREELACFKALLEKKVDNESTLCQFT